VSTQYNKIFVNLGRRWNQALSYSASGREVWSGTGPQSGSPRRVTALKLFGQVEHLGQAENALVSIELDRKLGKANHRGVRLKSGPVSVAERLRCSLFEVAGYLRYLAQMLIGSGHDQNVPGFDLFIFSWMEE